MVLVVSDGVGGLVLTRSGTRRAPAPLSLPGNAVGVQSRMSLRDRAPGGSEIHGPVTFADDVVMQEKLDVTGDLHVGGNLTVGGNITAGGSIAHG